LGWQVAERWLGHSGRLPRHGLGFRARATGGLALQPAAADLPGVAALVGARWPHDAEMLCKRAEAALSGRFDLLGYHSLWFGEPIDWCLDPLRGRRAPDGHWSRVPYLDVGVVGDHKLVWELNRHRHFITLAQAYWLTGARRYLEGLEQQWRHWMACNPPTRGINWASSLEVSLRSVAWLWAASLARPVTGDREDFWSEVARSLLAHGRHLERYLSTYFSPNTHLTGEALGLLYLGCRLDDTPITRRWRALGWRVLCEQLERQVHPDGVYFEQTTWYQRYTVDFYLHALLLANEAGLQVPTGFRDRLERAADVLLHLMRPDGTTPLLGDDDGGRLCALDDAPSDDFRGTLALAAAVLDRRDYCFGAGAPCSSLVWLLGPDGLARFQAQSPVPPQVESRAFPDGGCYVLRDGWSAGSSVMVVDAGPHGSLAAGHAHADALSFDLTLGGTPILVDPGTVSYVGAERERFRSTAVHNTAMVDEVSSSEPDGMFRWSRWARTSVESWFTRPWVDGLTASHDGYTRLPDPVVHQRTVLFLKESYWLVVDRFTARGRHRIRSRFQTAAGVSVDRRGAGLLRLSAARGAAGGVAALLRVSAPGRLDLVPGAISRCYGSLEPALAVESELECVGSVGVLSLIGLEDRLTGVQLDGGPTAAGWHWRLAAPGWVDDVVLTAPGGDLRAAGLQVHDGIAWRRRDPAGAPVAVVGMAKGALIVDGVTWQHEGRALTGRWAHGTLTKEA
jgi:hypothetical protein